MSIKVFDDNEDFRENEEILFSIINDKSSNSHDSKNKEKTQGEFAELSPSQITNINLPEVNTLTNQSASNTSNTPSNYSFDKNIVEILNTSIQDRYSNLIHIHINTFIKYKYLLKKMLLLNNGFENNLFVITLNDKIITENIFLFRRMVKKLTLQNVEVIIYGVKEFYDYIGAMLITYFKSFDLQYDNYIHMHTSIKTEIKEDDTFSDNSSVFNVEKSNFNKNIAMKLINYENNKGELTGIFPTILDEKFKKVLGDSNTPSTLEFEYILFNHINLKKEHLDVIVKLLVEKNDEHITSNLDDMLAVFKNNGKPQLVFEYINYLIDISRKIYHLNVDLFYLQNSLEYKYLINVDIVGRGVLYSQGFKRLLEKSERDDMLTEEALKAFSDGKSKPLNTKEKMSIFDDKLEPEGSVKSSVKSSDKKSDTNKSSNTHTSGSKSTALSETSETKSAYLPMLDLDGGKDVGAMKNSELSDYLAKYLDSDILFIAEPTSVTDLRYNIRNVNIICQHMDRFKYKGIIVVISNINPDTIDYLKRNYENLVIYYCPHIFACESNHRNKAMFCGQNQIVLGKNGNVTETHDFIISAFFRLNYRQVPYICNFHEAVAYKMFCHSFYVMNMNFMRDVDSYCGKMDIDANQVKKFMIKNNRVNVFKTNPFVEENDAYIGETGIKNDFMVLSCFMKRKQVHAKIMNNKVNLSL